MENYVSYIYQNIYTQNYRLHILKYPGRVPEVDSLFFYLTGESYATYLNASFTPRFYEDLLANLTSAQLALAISTCNAITNKECMYDFMITGKADVAAATLSTNTNNIETSANLGLE